MEYITHTENLSKTFAHEAKSHLMQLRQDTQEENRKRLAHIRHKLAQEAEHLAHTATVVVTATKLATGSHELEMAEIAAATTSLTLGFLHAAHHKYMHQQKLKHAA